jgi:hypothetical protein
MSTYGVIFPMRYSPRVIGVTNICSSVPRSRSLTTAWLMITDIESIMMSATRPGIMALTALSDGLNSTRTRVSIPGAPVIPRVAMRVRLKAPITWAA